MSPARPPTSPSTRGDQPIPPVAHPAAVDLRPFMAAFPTGVAVITSFDAAGRPWGMTCTSLCSISLDPASLVVSLRSASPTLGAVRAHGGFALNLLHDRAQATSQRFSSGDPERFDTTDWDIPPLARGPHLITDAHATADCVLLSTTVIGDHTAAFAEVKRVVTRDLAPAPLLYGLRRYARWPVPAAAVTESDRHTNRLTPSNP
ncbi:flavin reductase family protein (plasmid) [Streptomyces sp. R39]|uniref:Flavin reductase family protein n=1 Tax=Streptomyces sp. R39 TaxID=3238631 RepID=A0AB39R6D0_9ACTN